MKVGVTLPLAEDANLGRARSYAEIRELAGTAEASGLDSIWVFDHLFFDQPFAEFVARRGPGTSGRLGAHEGWTVLSALAADTRRVALGTLTLVAGFRNPALLAKMAATADEVSGGRLILGLGCGWNPPEFEAFGFPWERRVSRFEESLQIIRPLLRGQRVTFRGEFHEVVDAELRPPPRPGGPPILIASRRPRMHRIAARYADAWNGAWLGAVDELDARLDGVRVACLEVSRPLETLEITVGVNVVFPALGPSGMRPRGSALSGNSLAVARGIAAYASRGVDHLIARVLPPTPAAYEALGEARALALAGSGPSS